MVGLPAFTRDLLASLNCPLGFVRPGNQKAHVLSRNHLDEAGKDGKRQPTSKTLLVLAGDVACIMLRFPGVSSEKLILRAALERDEKAVEPNIGMS